MSAHLRPAGDRDEMHDPREATVLVVDAANVVGSVPDGWWRDRRAAAGRLRDRLALLVTRGDSVAGLPPPVDLVLVVEGAARGIHPAAGVRVHEAPGSGDDAIVEIVRDEVLSGRAAVVVTADRALRSRVIALGARAVGPRTLG